MKRRLLKDFFEKFSCEYYWGVDLGGSVGKKVSIGEVLKKGRGHDDVEKQGKSKDNSMRLVKLIIVILVN